MARRVSAGRRDRCDEPIVYQPLYTATVAGIAPLVQASAGAAGVAEMIRARVRALDSRLTARPETVSATIAGEASQYAAVISAMAIPFCRSPNMWVQGSLNSKRRLRQQFFPEGGRRRVRPSAIQLNCADRLGPACGHSHLGVAGGE